MVLGRGQRSVSADKDQSHVKLNFYHRLHQKTNADYSRLYPRGQTWSKLVQPSGDCTLRSTTPLLVPTEHKKFSPHLLRPLRSGSFHVMAALFWTSLSLAFLCSHGGDQSTEAELEIAGFFIVHDGCFVFHEWLYDRFRDVQLMEAMRFATEEINANSTFLPGIKLVPSLKFLCGRKNIRPQVRDVITSKTIGAFIDTGRDYLSDEVIDSLEDAKIPVITTSMPDLKQTNDPFFLHMVPSAQYQFKAIIDLLIHHGWTYVSVMSSSDVTFSSAMKEFKKEAEQHKVCFATTIIKCKTDDYEDHIKNLQSHPRAHVVVLFVDLLDLDYLLYEVTILNASFTWVIGAPWGLTEKILETYNKAPGRVISVDIQSYPLQRFNEYLQAKMVANASNFRNQKLFSEDFFIPPTSKKPPLTLPKDVQPSPQIMFIVNTVYAIAHALQNMSSSTCPNMSADCVREHNDTFMTFLRKTKFTAPFIPLDVEYMVKFDEAGDGPARYNIFSVQEINGHHQYQQIGSWAENLTLNASQSMWKDNTPPESHCGKPCGKHNKKIIDQANPCCWVCIKCHPNEVLMDEFTCKKCNTGYRFNRDRNSCMDFIRWGDGLAIGSLCFSGLGILSTIFVGGVLLWNNNTPIVKASGREFCYILLSGVLLLYIMTFIFIAHPSVVICGLRRLGLATSFAICYSALLTKTNRITRIFNSAQKGIAPPRYINLASQLSICLALITCQILGLVIWLIVDPAEVIEIPSSDKHITINCKSGDMRILLSLVYNVLLILLCTVYAFKTRKYPENFNEAKCIGFTMYTTCIIWLSSVPVYYVTSDHPKVQVTTLCASISLCGLVILGGLFVPKLYIIFCHPEQNVKSRQRLKSADHTERSHGTTGEVFLSR
ncbi:metabotropic glutamate receptor 2-like [Engystomops pustulosus]|uniref:metabotropic glutamate receptor 2-like n=1 Tax=Engystomops pustulosus TaxID=76066 RepID=UPI003AFAA1C0